MLTFSVYGRLNSFAAMHIRAFLTGAYVRCAGARAFAASLIFSGNFRMKLLIVCFLASLVVAVFGRWGEFTSVYEELNEPGFGLCWLDITRALLFVNIGIFIWRIILVARYRPTAAVGDEELPNCTVIVPAYNEGRCVLDTLTSIALSDYPASKLQIIAVDDGSVDDTWDWMQSAVSGFPGRIESIRLAKNSGKRRALYEGILRSTGEVLVTIDSDSVVETGTLRSLISPFVRDRRVGAVAGDVRVSNLKEGAIPRMMDVSFAYSFDFTRASQSMVDTVFCTPGALSAYRKCAVMKNLDGWFEQKFLGRRATIGEDRAMTNMIIRDGWKVKFQSDATVYTNIPAGYTKACKMLLRWARSNIRETIVMSRFLFTSFRRSGKSGARINFILNCFNLLMPRALAGALVAGAYIESDVYLLQLLAGASVWACASAIFYALRRRNSDALYAFAYSVFWLFGLSWITPYAMLTPANGKWMTRELKAGPLKPAGQPLDVPTRAAA